MGFRVKDIRFTIKVFGIRVKGTAHVTRYKRVSGKGYRVSITAQGKLFRISD